MRQVSNELEIFRGDAVLKQTFTMISSIDMTTAADHGLKVDDVLRLTTATTLPAGLSLVTDYYVVKVVSSTKVNISTSKNGAAITTTDGGTGTHSYTLSGEVFKVYDYGDVDLSAFTSDSFNGTIKIQISNQVDVNFNNAASKTNRWSYVQLKDLQDAATKNGSVGIASAGTDIANTYEINLNRAKYLSAAITAHTAGKISLIAVGFTE